MFSGLTIWQSIGVLVTEEGTSPAGFTLLTFVRGRASHVQFGVFVGVIRVHTWVVMLVRLYRYSFWYSRRQNLIANSMILWLLH